MPVRALPSGHSRFLFTSRPALGKGAWRRSSRAARGRNSRALGLRREGTHGVPWPFPHVTPHQHAWGFLTHCECARAHTHTHTHKHLTFPFLLLAGARPQASPQDPGIRGLPSSTAPGRTGGLPDVAPAGPARSGTRGHPASSPLPALSYQLLAPPPGVGATSLSTPNSRRRKPSHSLPAFLPARSRGFPAPRVRPGHPCPPHRPAPVWPGPVRPKLERAPVLAPPRLSPDGAGLPPRSPRPRSPLPGAVPGAPPAQVRGGATGRPLVAGMARCGLKKGNSTQVRAADPSYCHRKRQGPLIEHLLCAHPMLNIDVRSLSPHNCPVR